MTKQALIYHFVFKNLVNLIAQLKTNIHVLVGTVTQAVCRLCTLLVQVSLTFLMLVGFVVLGLW